jgi:hypothetical protein
MNVYPVKTITLVDGKVIKADKNRKNCMVHEMVCPNGSIK